MEFPSTESTEKIGACQFRCQRDAKCLPRWSQVCDGRADCADNSDEAKCPPPSPFLQSPASQHHTQQTPSPHPDFMQEVSGIQICIVAVALVLTFGLITCIINHYNKMGARPWSGDQRKHHDHSRKSTSATTPRALYSPSKAREYAKRELLLYQEHQLRRLSVQRDLALNLPYTVQRPDVEDDQQQPLSSKSTEIPRAYLKPPPNRTVAPGGLVKYPSQSVHKHSLKTATGYKLVTHPSFHQATKKSNPSLFVRVSNNLERWNPPRPYKDVCTISIFNDSVTAESDDLPPKYEDVVQLPKLPSRTSRHPSHVSSVIQSFRKMTQ